MKLSEMRELSVEDLNNKIVENKEELFKLRMQKALHKLENTAKIGQLKTEIAQIKTIIKEKSK